MGIRPDFETRACNQLVVLMLVRKTYHSPTNRCSSNRCPISDHIWEFQSGWCPPSGSDCHCVACALDQSDSVECVAVFVFASGVGVYSVICRYLTQLWSVRQTRAPEHNTSGLGAWHTCSQRAGRIQTSRTRSLECMARVFFCTDYPGKYMKIIGQNMHAPRHTSVCARVRNLFRFEHKRIGLLLIPGVWTRVLCCWRSIGHRSWADFHVYCSDPESGLWSVRRRLWFEWYGPQCMQKCIWSLPDHPNYSNYKWIHSRCICWQIDAVYANYT